MNKQRFLTDLLDAMGSMPDARRREILYDYEEHFSMGLSEGKTENEISKSLGDPRVIGNSYRIEALLDSPADGGNPSSTSVLRAVFASISLTFMNIVFVLGPFMGLVGIMFGMWAVVASLTVSGVAFIVSPIWPDSAQFIASHLMNDLFVFFLGLGLTALGVLSGIGMLMLTKWFFTGVAAYVRFNTRIIRGAK